MPDNYKEESAVRAIWVADKAATTQIRHRLSRCAGPRRSVLPRKVCRRVPSFGISTTSPAICSLGQS